MKVDLEMPTGGFERKQVLVLDPDKATYLQGLLGDLEAV